MIKPLNIILTLHDEDQYKASEFASLNSVMILKLIRDELHNCGKHYPRDTWQNNILRHCIIKARSKPEFTRDRIMRAVCELPPSKSDPFRDVTISYDMLYDIVSENIMGS